QRVCADTRLLAQARRRDGEWPLLRRAAISGSGARRGSALAACALLARGSIVRRGGSGNAREPGRARLGQSSWRLPFDHPRGCLACALLADRRRGGITACNGWLSFLHWAEAHE